MAIFNIAMEFPSLASDGTFTFAGVLQKYFYCEDPIYGNTGISKNWNDNTKMSYIRDYEERLIPVLVSEFGKEKPIHDFSEENFIRVLNILRSKHNYKDTTMEHYRRLLWVVYMAGVEHGCYEDQIFWIGFDDIEDENPEKQEKQRIQDMTRTRKSLSIDENLSIINWFRELDPLKVPGEDVGVLFMFFEGVRNNEACGANYSSVHFLNTYNKTPVFDMVQSTTTSNKIKAGGKTSNAPRVIPLLLPFFNFLTKRKELLIQQIACGSIILPPGIDSVDQLPIVCKGCDYFRRASTHDVTSAARSLFKKIGISKSELAYLQQLLFGQEFQNMQLEEKEPTAYLLRRNCSTILYNIEFTTPEVQYWIGHGIDDPALTRNSFADEESINDIATKIKKHPFHCLLCPTDETVVVEEAFQGYENDKTFAIDVDEASSSFILSVTATEPQDEILVTIDSDKQIRGNASVSAPVTEFKTEVQNSSRILEVYKKHDK